jgi:integrase
MTKTKSIIHRTLAQATGGVLLATADNDLCIVPARSAAAEAAREAQQTGEQVTLRDPVTDQVLAIASPGGGVSTSVSLDHTRKRMPNKRKLTELFVRKLKPKAAAFIVWDTLQRGLVLRVQPSGRRSWNCVYNRQGRTRWMHLGAADAIGLADARQLAAEAMLEVARGKDPAAERRATRGSGTFAELADRYLEHAKKVNKSWRQGRALIERFALPRFGKLQASVISRSDVRGLIAGIEAPVVANQTLAAISAVFTWGTNNDLIAVNPCRGIAQPNPTASRDRTLNDSELPRVWVALGEMGVAGRCLKTVLLTGQRPGECSHIRYEHIDSGRWTLPGEPVPSLGWSGTKNKQTHMVWLPKPARDLVGDGKTGFVFAEGRRGRPVRSLDAVMRAVCAKLSISPAVRPHDLRRSFLTILASLGHGRQALDRIANHADRSISTVYDRFSYAEKDRVIMEEVAARIVELAEGRVAGNILTFTTR